MQEVEQRSAPCSDNMRMLVLQFSFDVPVTEGSRICHSTAQHEAVDGNLLLYGNVTASYFKSKADPVEVFPGPL